MTAGIGLGPAALAGATVRAAGIVAGGGLSLAAHWPGRAPSGDVVYILVSRPPVGGDGARKEELWAPTPAIPALDTRP